jgi:hypothetical protein
MAEWSSLEVPKLDSTPIILMPWPTWGATPDAVTSVLTVAVPTTVERAGPTMTMTQDAATVTQVRISPEA